METNGHTNGNGNGHTKNSRSRTRSRSSSKPRSENGLQNNTEKSPKNTSDHDIAEPHGNGDIYDPTQSDNDDSESKNEEKNNVVNKSDVVNADYHSDDNLGEEK